MSDPTQRPMGRRTFLGIAGTVGIAAGCSPKAATQRVLPWLVPPEDIVPGVPLYYRTVCRACGAGCGVTARTREGRAVKLEGNPEDPIGAGALCARGQASIQALYHPERFKGPLRRGDDGKLAPLAWDAAEDTLVAAIGAARAKGPGRVRLLTRPEPGSAGVLQRAFLAGIGARPEDRVVLDPLDPAPVRAASQALFGRAELPVIDLSAARTVVLVGEDLETSRSPVELARQLASGRGRVGDARTRLTWIGPRLSITGMAADRWVRARSGGELAFALAVLRWIVDPRNGVAGLGPDAPALFHRLQPLAPADLAARAGVGEADVARLARELAARRPSAILGPGPSAQGPDATRLAAVLLLANLVLGNVGRTVVYGLDPLLDPPSPTSAVQTLFADAAAGRVDVLLVQGADPVGTLPASLGAAAALDRVPLVAAFAPRPDATTPHARLVLADHHALESFGDVVPRRGIVNLGQPVMIPLADTRPASQVLLDLGGKLPPATPPLPSGDLADWRDERMKAYAAEALGNVADPAAAQRDAQQRGGFWFDASAARGAPALRPRAADPFLSAPPQRAAGGGDLDLVLVPSPLRGPAGADLPWLREVPDPVSTLSWTAWAEVSPASAARLGVVTGDVVAIATAAGRAEVPAYVTPGIRDDAVALPLGPEASAVLPLARDEGSGAIAYASARATLRRAGRHPALPILEGSPYQHGREIVRTVSAAAPALARPALAEQMYRPPRHPEHRWAMAIDLDRCTGCSACVVACFAENNVPVMGPQAASEGRYMGWLRVERYLGDEPGGPLDPQILLMLCQHCTNAPCEPVCPVYATYHTAEGLNAQVYNRCVGTRYCNNNCPYKVRVFNWRDPRFPEPLNMQLNPDVTVRSRGVMEKCTFCVQRIRYAEDRARLEGRPVHDGEVVTACAQTCPTRAIVFGDANDPESRVSRLAREPRGFRVLEDLNTQPAITYLARVREPEGT
jgi:anaerobic selenocysteine-containing dehydrogenase/Fe-S-cluster-containing dehydrogenase component